MKGHLWLLMGLLILTLACALPKGTASPAGPTPTPQVYVTVLVATPTPGGARPTGDVPMPTVTLSATATLSGTAAITATVTPTKAEHAKATATPAPPGPPLSFSDPPWSFVEWHPIPNSGDYEGTIALNVNGGTPPYRSQLEDQPIVAGLTIPVRWRLCEPMPATVRVWSADGQQVEAKIWVWKVGCK